MKLILTSALVALLGSAASAEVTAEIFRPAGCDVETLVPVLSELNPGEILYWTNTDGKGCNAYDGGDSDGRQLFRYLESIRPVKDPGDSDNGGDTGEGDGNNGHGDEEDGHDESNPGNGEA